VVESTNRAALASAAALYQGSWTQMFLGADYSKQDAVVQEHLVRHTQLGSVALLHRCSQQSVAEKCFCEQS
jgi:hypothetical protein